MECHFINSNIEFEFNGQLISLSDSWITILNFFGKFIFSRENLYKYYNRI